MAANYPYVNAPGPLHALLVKLRTSFPSQLNVETLKRLGLAAQNESYIINSLRFLGIIDEKGARKADDTKGFLGNDDQYNAGIEKLVRHAYKELFDTHGDAAWNLDRAELVTFFRMADGTSEVVGGRQASTFQIFAQHAGKLEGPPPKSPQPRKTPREATTKKKAAKGTSRTPLDEFRRNGSQGDPQNGMNFSIRLELNLPSSDDQKVYDAIFKSIRENLLDPYRS